MDNKKKGLGRGLGALFAEYESFPEADELNLNESPEIKPQSYQQPRSEAVPQSIPRAYSRVDEPVRSDDIAREVPIYKIVPNANQPRKSFDPDSLKELSSSIRTHGIISPIIVVRNGDNYMIIAGERRWRAAKDAGLVNVPVIVRSYNKQEIKEISLIENLQREDLNPIECANAIKELMEEHHFTQEAVADRIGKSRPAIANTLRLLTLTPEVVSLVANGRLSAGHARCLVVLTDAEVQIKFAKAASDNKMTVRQLEKAVKDYFNPKKQAAKQPEQSIELKELIANMQRVFATKVSALGNDKRGRIYIDYYSRDDLDRLVDLLDLVERVKSKL